MLFFSKTKSIQNYNFQISRRYSLQQYFNAFVFTRIFVLADADLRLSIVKLLLSKFTNVLQAVNFSEWDGCSNNFLLIISLKVFKSGKLRNRGICHTCYARACLQAVLKLFYGKCQQNATKDIL